MSSCLDYLIATKIARVSRVAAVLLGKVGDPLSCQVLYTQSFLTQAHLTIFFRNSVVIVLTGAKFK